MPNEDSIDITIISDAEKNIHLDKVPADKVLEVYLISKASADRLSAKYEVTPKSTVTDSKGRSYNVIGKVELGWHRRNASKSFRRIFSVVDALPTGAVLGKDALAKDRESNALPIGLDKQTGGIFTPCHLSPDVPGFRRP